MAKFCSNCGNKVEEGQAVCLKCGFALKDNAIANSDAKSKVIAGMLGICFGALGVHNFYLGYKGKAIAQLLITCLSFGLLYFVSSTWGFIEGILILVGTINKDADGNELGD